MEKRHLTLLQKTVFAVIVVALPLIITFLYNYKKNTEYIKGETLVDLANTELVYEGLIYQFFEKAENRVQDFSSDGYIRDGTQKILEGQKSSVKILSDYISKNKLNYPKAIFIISDGMGNSVKPQKPENWYWFLSVNCIRHIPKKSKFYNLSDFE